MNTARLISNGALALASLCLFAMPAAHAAPRHRIAAYRSAQGRHAAARKQPAPVDPAAGMTGLAMTPGSVALDGPRAQQHIMVTATFKDGTTADVTDRVAFGLGNTKLAKIAGGVVTPVADGQTHLVARLGRLSSPSALFTIRNAEAPASVRFVSDVMPILAKAGCNSTACHGSPAGKNGFKLSLFGYDPAADYNAIVKDSDGRRVNLKDPTHSLVLLKPTFTIPHGGGPRFKVNSPEYRTLLTWLKSGAPGIDPSEPHIQSVSVTPEQPWMPKPGARQHLIVTATLSDGSTRDVTDKALFSANDDAIAAVGDDGVVTAKRPGETAIMVRYMGQVAVSRVAVLPPWKLPHYPKLAQNNFIDQLVQAKLQKLRIVPSGLCTDEEFIRRATLDTCGIIPTPEEVRAFVADPAPDKRAKLIDQLLARPEFVDLWTLKWNDILRNNPRFTREGAVYYSNWIREQIQKDRPFDQWVRDLLTATGKSADYSVDPTQLPPNVQMKLQQRQRAEALIDQINRAPFNPAVNYYLITRDPLDLTSATSQTFLGVRIECARCHNHPFEKWTQSDYYHLAAFFTGVNARGVNQTPRVVTVNERASLRMPVTNEIISPRPLDGPDAAAPAAPGTRAAGGPGADRRQALAEWLTSRDNPWFAQATVNRIWDHYFGRGIVEPVDDFRVTNPPANPELLKALAADFVAHHFDLNYIHRLILNSRTYQQSSIPNQYNRQDTSNFSHFYPKRMMAEQLYDSISQATGVFLPQPPARRPGGKNGIVRKVVYNPADQVTLASDGPITRVMQLSVLGPGPRGPRGDLGVFLDTFGKPRREVVCSCERSTDGNVGQALALINGDEVNAKLASPLGRVQQLAREEKPDAEVIDELYLAALSRRPTGQEQKEAAALIQAAKTRADGISDLMWSLLNSREFLFIH